MSTWTVVLLGLVALGSLVQSAFLIAMALSALKLSRRVSAMQIELTGEIQPAIADLLRVQENLADASARLALQSERVEMMVADVTQRIDEAREAVMPIAAKLVTVVAAVKTVRRGLRMFREFRRR